MIVFITSIRHPNNSSSYGQVLALLERSLKSVCNQADDDFQVIVVCNELPELRYHHPKIEYVVTSFPPPSTIAGPMTGLSAVRMDKGAKYAIGVSTARKHHPDYVMFFDADDFIHRDIAGFCNANKGQNGWYVVSGYKYKEGSLLCIEISDFYRFCGTCNILSFESMAVPSHITGISSLAEVLESVEPYFLTDILGAHPFTPEYFASQGSSLAPLPFPGAVYVIATGENHSGNTLFSSLPRLVDHRMNVQFGMDLDLSAARRLKAVLLEYPVEAYRVLRYAKYPELMESLRKSVQHSTRSY